MKLKKEKENISICYGIDSSARKIKKKSTLTLTVNIDSFSYVVKECDSCWLI